MNLYLKGMYVTFSKTVDCDSKNSIVIIYVIAK